MRGLVVFLILILASSGCVDSNSSEETPVETVENYFEALDEGQDIEEINSRAIINSSFYFDKSQTNTIQETDVNVLEVEQKSINEVVDDVELFEDSILEALEQIYGVDIEEYEIVYAETDIDASNLTYMQALTFGSGDYYVLIRHENRWKIIFNNDFASLEESPSD